MKYISKQLLTPHNYNLYATNEHMNIILHSWIFRSTKKQKNWYYNSLAIAVNCTFVNVCIFSHSGSWWKLHCQWQFTKLHLTPNRPRELSLEYTPQLVVDIRWCFAQPREYYGPVMCNHMQDCTTWLLDCITGLPYWDSHRRCSLLVAPYNDDDY